MFAADAEAQEPGGYVFLSGELAAPEWKLDASTTETLSGPPLRGQGGRRI